MKTDSMKMLKITLTIENYIYIYIYIYEYLPVSQLFMALEYGFLLFLAKVSTLNIWPKVIHPTKSTTLSRPCQT